MNVVFTPDALAGPTHWAVENGTLLCNDKVMLQLSEVIKAQYTTTATKEGFIIFALDLRTATGKASVLCRTRLGSNDFINSQNFMGHVCEVLGETSPAVRVQMGHGIAFRVALFTLAIAGLIYGLYMTIDEITARKIEWVFVVIFGAIGIAGGWVAWINRPWLPIEYLSPKELGRQLIMQATLVGKG